MKKHSILHDNFGMMEIPMIEIGGKETVLRNINWFKNYFDYVSFDDTEGAYPDMLETKRF